MIKIAVFAFNPFQENTYVVSDPTGECVIIDAGNYTVAESNKLTQYIEKEGFRPVLALNTHGHVDHILGVEYVKEFYKIPFAVHSDDKFLIDAAQTHGAVYGFNVTSIPNIDIDLATMKEISFGETTMQILNIPGHTPGHVAFYEPISKTLLTGDTVFKESIGRTDLPGGDYGVIMKSILTEIVPLGDEVNIFPGHGPKTTIGHEVLNNPFIVEVVRGEIKY